MGTPRLADRLCNGSSRWAPRFSPWRPLLVLALLLCAGPLESEEAAPEDWAPIRPSDLASATPQVQSDADAEVLFWDVQVQDKLATFGLQSEHWNYIRIKVFTERGCEAHDAVDLTCESNTAIDDVAGRTVHPDGSIVRLRPEDIHARTLIQVGRRRDRVTSFVLPAVTPGSVIEYHWHETRKRRLSAYGRLQFQRDIPVRQVTYHIRPLSVQGERFEVKTRVFNAPNIPIEKDARGELTITMSNLPAAQDEPLMPPGAEQRPWLLYFYAEQEKGALPVYAKQLYDAQRPRLKLSRSVRDAATRMLHGARNGEDSLARLYSYCQTNIRNASEESSRLLPSEAEALDDDAPADETLRARAGTATAINWLFCIMARCAGFEARMALAGDAADVLPATQVTSRSFFTGSVVAIPAGPRWRLFDPGWRSVPFGMLPWRKERSAVLIPDPRAPVVIEPVPARPESSSISRSAVFRLGEDGSLAGKVRVEHRGHVAVHERDERAGLSPTEWQEAVKAGVRADILAGIPSNMRIDCPREASRPCIYDFDLQVPGFAMVSGKRLVLAPAVFQAGRPPLFPSQERRSSVVFPYSWSEFDTVIIALPSGYTLEAADPPVSFRIGAGGRFSSGVGSRPNGDTLVLVRSQSFHGMTIERREYPTLWQAFRELHEVDNRVVSVARRSSR